MPTYQYACTACEHRFDAVQSFSDASLTECPECAGRLRKLYGSVGVVFKGSGFYRTDSRAEGSKSASSEDKPAEKSTEKSGEKAAEKSSGSETKKADSGAKESNSSSSTTTTTKPAAAAP